MTRYTARARQRWNRRKVYASLPVDVVATERAAATSGAGPGHFHQDRKDDPQMRASAPCLCGHALGDHAAGMACLADGFDCGCRWFRRNQRAGLVRPEAAMAAEVHP
jgi:hypothetical protein